MRQWPMRTTLLVSLLSLSLGLMATLLLVVRMHVRQQIQSSLASDLEHSLATFQNLERQRNQMLSREAALLADLPSLKALLASQDAPTIEDGIGQFRQVSGSDLFALADAQGRLVAELTRDAEASRSNAPQSDAPRSEVPQSTVAADLEQYLRDPEREHIVALGAGLYEMAVQPVYFGQPENQSRLGYVLIGSAVGRQMAHEVSEAAAADVVFLNEGQLVASTLPADRLPSLLAQAPQLSQSHDPSQQGAERMQLSRAGHLTPSREAYLVATVPLTRQSLISQSPSQSSSHPASARLGGPRHGASLIVLKSYDQASMFLDRLNRNVLGLGALVFLIAVLLAIVIARQVTRPLEALVAGTRALGKGDFDFALAPGGAAEVRELALAFERMRGELRRTQHELLDSERLATIGRMASSVSHDLRHHLSAIYANAEFMSLAPTRQSEREELLEDVRQAVQEMTDLIESLLLFSQTGRSMQPHAESLSALMERVAAMVRKHPEGREVEILVEAPQPILAMVDGQKLARALYNLTLNGCQSARRGVPPARVTLSLEQDDTRISIRITDTGNGVHEGIRETLFQPFVSAGKQNGVGLGLTLAHHIAQEHGGGVSLDESTPGRTVFTILLMKQELLLLSKPEPEAPGIAAPKLIQS